METVRSFERFSENGILNYADKKIKSGIHSLTFSLEWDKDHAHLIVQLRIFRLTIIDKVFHFNKNWK